MYGYRARIGYLAALPVAEVFAVDFYKLVPAGVSLMMATWPIDAQDAGHGADDPRSRALNLLAAKTFAAQGADLIVLGNPPLPWAQGLAKLEDYLRGVEAQVGVQVVASAVAQHKAFRALGARQVGIVHPFGADRNDEHARELRDFFGLDCIGVRAGGRDFATLGKIPIDAALEWGRALKQQHPGLDTLFIACPHWRVIDAIDALEQELKVTVVTTLQAVAWEAMRRTGVNNRLDGYGRLLKEY